MSKLVQINITETRHKTKMLLEVTDDEIVDLVDLLESQKVTQATGWSGMRHVTTLRPRLASLLHNLRTGPQEVREETIERGVVADA